MRFDGGHFDRTEAMSRFAHLLVGLLLGASIAILTLQPAGAHDVACPPPPPCVVALTPEQIAEVEAMKAQVEALKP